MQGTFKIRDPNQVEFTLTLKATLLEWKKLSEQLSVNWPSSGLSAFIADMVSAAQKEFTKNDSSCPQSDER